MLKAGRGWVTVVSFEPCISMQCVVKRTHSGLARPMEGSADNSTMAQQSMQIGTIGTPGHTDSQLVVVLVQSHVCSGYIDPEYIRTGEFHRHSDVYAMGM